MVNRFHLGLLLAPLAAPLLYFAGVLVYSPVETTIAGLGVGLLFVSVFVAPVSYAGSLLLGLPVIALLRAKGQLSIYSCLLSGISIGFVLGGLIAWAFADFKPWSQVATNALLWLATVGGVLGVSVALCFCFIAGITLRSSGPKKATLFSAAEL